MQTTTTGILSYIEKQYYFLQRCGPTGLEKCGGQENVFILSDLPWTNRTLVLYLRLLGFQTVN